MGWLGDRSEAPRLVPAVALLAASLAGCGGDKHAPFLGDCDAGKSCGGSPIANGGSGGAGGGTSGVSGGASAGSTGTATSAGVALNVTVRLTTDERFSNTLAYSGRVRVGARGVDGSEVAATGVATSLAIAGVAPGANWFAVSDDPAGAGNLFPTLEPVAVDPATPQAELVAIPIDFAFLYLSFGLAMPDSSVAQAIVSFVRAGVPLAGVKIAGDVPDGGQVAMAGEPMVAYDSAGGYELATSAAASATGPLGTALLINWQAGPYFPGSTARLVYTVAGSTSPFATDIVLANGFVTRVVISVP